MTVQKLNRIRSTYRVASVFVPGSIATIFSKYQLFIIPICTKPYRKSCIWETKNLWTDADSRTETTLKRLCDLKKEEKKKGCGIFLKKKWRGGAFFLDGGRGRLVRGWDLIM